MEWFITESGKYRIESLTAATFPGALRVIKDAFCVDEAVCIGTEMYKDPVAVEELLELCADAALDGASLVAVETDTGEVVSVAFNKLQALTSERTFFDIFVEQRCKRGSSRSLIKFMADVDARCNLFEKYGVDCSLEIMFLATLREHRQLNLGTLLCKYSIELAKKLKEGPVAAMTLQDLGPKYSTMPHRAPVTKSPKICQAIWTSEGSKIIGKSLDFKIGLTVSFQEFVYNGKSYAERLGDESAFCEVAAFRLH